MLRLTPLAGILLLFCLNASASMPQVVRINSGYTPPLSTPDQDGYFDLLLKEAFSRIGLTVEIVLLPAERSLVEAARGQADGDVGRVAAIADIYPDLLMVPEPVLDQRQFVAFSLHPCSTPDWASLAGKHIGFLRGWKIFEQNRILAASSIRTETLEQLFLLLEMGRIDLALTARLDGLVMTKNLGLDNVVVCEPPLAVQTMYLYLHRKHADLVLPLSNALREIKNDGTAETIKTRLARDYVPF